jgi:hypothetical protein
MQQVKNCLELADYLYKGLLKVQDEINYNLYPFKNEMGLCVLMKKPIKEVCEKFLLSSEELPCPEDKKGKKTGEKMKFAHILVMRHVTKNFIDKYLNLIKEMGKDAFSEKEEEFNGEPINKLHHMHG